MLAPDMLDLPAELHFPHGLVGLPDLHRFSLGTLDDTPFLLLDSLDDSVFGFIVAPADLARHGYAGQVRDQGMATGEDIVLVVLAVHGTPPVMTANLAGPIVVDLAGTATQVVLEGDAFPLRASVAGPA